MSGTINTAADLISSINAGNSFQLTGDNQIKTQGIFSKILQAIGDKLWRSPEQIEARKLALDTAMTRLLSDKKPLPNITQENLLNASTKLPAGFEATVKAIQNRFDIQKFPAGKKHLAQSILQKSGNAEFAKSVGLWKTSAENDPKAMERFNTLLKNDTNNYLKTFVSEEKNFSHGDDVPNQLYGDAGRETITVNGSKFKGDDNHVEPGINAFKEAVQEPAARRFLGTLLTQANTGLTWLALFQNTLPNDVPMPKDFPKFPEIKEPFLLTSPKELGEYSLVTSGGKEGHPEKATVTVTMKYPIMCTETKNGKAEPVGYITLKQEMHCTLGKTPTIDSAKMHYDFEGVGVAGVTPTFMSKLGQLLPGMRRV